MALGVVLNFSPIDPIKALYYSAVVNGVGAVPVMVMMMCLTRRPAIMGNFALPRSLQVMGCLATIHGSHGCRHGRVVVRVVEACVGRPTRGLRRAGPIRRADQIAD